MRKLEDASCRRISRHIEQGPVLEAEGKTSGIVTSVQALRWFDATVAERDSHAGATPMTMPRDALAATVEMVPAGQRPTPATARLSRTVLSRKSRRVIPPVSRTR